MSGKKRGEKDTIEGGKGSNDLLQGESLEVAKKGAKKAPENTNEVFQNGEGNSSGGKRREKQKNYRSEGGGGRIRTFRSSKNIRSA